MQLQDASDRAAVDLFLRSLEFSFDATSIVGIPGGIGLDKPNEDGQTAVLLHELEHVRTLVYPFGPILTALGVRASDLRHEFAEKFESWRTFIGTPLLETEPARTAATEALRSIQRMIRFAKRVHLTAHLMQPLLEGLAVLAEFEIEGEDASKAWDLLVEMEYFYAVHRLALSSPNHARFFEDDQRRAEVMRRISDSLNNQLVASRHKRRVLLRERLFFQDELDPSPDFAAPYFLGYFFLRQLGEAWRQKIPELTFGDFYHIATKALCEVLPLSLMNLYTLDPDRFVTDDFPTVYHRALKMLRSLSVEHIRRIQNHATMLAIRSDGEEAEVYEFQPKDLGGEEFLFGLIQVQIFDADDLNTQIARDNADMLIALERAKFLTPTYWGKALIHLVNDADRTAYLIDEATFLAKGRLRHTTAERPVSTSFVFKDQEDFDQFLQLADREGGLGRMIAEGEEISFRPAKHLVSVYLRTYLYFWPLGVRNDVGWNPGMTIARRMFIQVDGKMHSFDSSRYGVAELATNAGFRELAEDLRKNIAAAIEPDFTDCRRVLNHFRLVYPELSNEIDPVLTEADAKWFDKAKRRSTAVYTTLLFPELAGSPTLPIAKLSVLESHLNAADYTQLRRWLRNGILIHPARSYAVGAAVAEQTRQNVERIAAACKQVLGIPVVAFREEPPAVVLSLLPESF